MKLSDRFPALHEGYILDGKLYGNNQCIFRTVDGSYCIDGSFSLEEFSEIEQWITEGLPLEDDFYEEGKFR